MSLLPLSPFSLVHPFGLFTLSPFQTFTLLPFHPHPFHPSHLFTLSLFHPFYALAFVHQWVSFVHKRSTYAIFSHPVVIVSTFNVFHRSLVVLFMLVDSNRPHALANHVGVPTVTPQV